MCKEIQQTCSGGSKIGALDRLQIHRAAPINTYGAVPCDQGQWHILTAQCFGVSGIRETKDACSFVYAKYMLHDCIWSLNSIYGRLAASGGHTESDMYEPEAAGIQLVSDDRAWGVRMSNESKCLCEFSWIISVFCSSSCVFASS
jgi:hypothetical protein